MNTYTVYLGDFDNTFKVIGTIDADNELLALKLAIWQFGGHPIIGECFGHE